MRHQSIISVYLHKVTRRILYAMCRKHPCLKHDLNLLVFSTVRFVDCVTI
jgi:hypothetical protein